MNTAIKLALLAVIITLVTVAVQYRHILQIELTQSSDVVAKDNLKVTIYGASWCGYCAKTRAFFDFHGVEFHEYDIEKSERGYREHKALGGRGVPVIRINNEVIYGFDTDRMLKLITETKQTNKT
jgi:mycoredoxin